MQNGVTTGEWVGLKEAAQRLGISVDTIRRKVKAAELPTRQAKIAQGFRYEVYLGDTDMQDAQLASPTRQSSDKLLDLLNNLTEQNKQLIDSNLQLAGQNTQLAGQLGFLQAQLQQAQAEILLLKAPPPLPEPEQKPPLPHPWWQFWKR